MRHSDGKPSPAEPPERRRFLRELLTGSVPLLLGWVAGQARLLSHLVQAPPAPRKTSPPPVARDAAPAPVKQSLDEHYQAFARDNPLPRSFPEDSRGTK